ncbi:hypothetical protein [Nocardioides dongkuii]|uniref:hypothetical protein n=1 Tax=Nocardioides dongkuii TaxID=2760089 RepID=UPI0015FDBBD7|nr:hypothetical protein [Nocardioides dongkuii]
MPPDRRPLYVLLAMVLANVGLVFGLGGTAGSLAQHQRVLDEDTLQACLGALIGDHEAWMYAVTGPVFDGPNTVAADFRRTTPASPHDEEAPPPRGRMRCTVAAGENVDAPMRVTRVVAVP